MSDSAKSSGSIATTQQQLDPIIQEFLNTFMFAPGQQGVNGFNGQHETPLIAIARNGNGNFKRIDETRHVNIDIPRVEVARRLIALGVDFNKKDGIAGPTGGHTPLIKASQYGQDAMVDFLLQQKEVETNATDNQGATGLYRAAQNGHTASVILLLKAGADPDLCPMWDWNNTLAFRRTL